MCFEYFYKNKPVIFYRLDKGDKFLNDYDRELQESMDEKDKYIFNVCADLKLVTQTIKKYINNSFELEVKNKKKLDKFFYFKKNIRDKIIDELIK
jgi:predicted DNA-binding ArsR family transcriptional regulator